MRPDYSRTDKHPKDSNQTAEKVIMDLTSLIDTAVPTPFGWVMTTQKEFDLEMMIAFQKQLVSLARACGTSNVPAPEPVAGEVLKA